MSEERGDWGEFSILSKRILYEMCVCVYEIFIFNEFFYILSRKVPRGVGKNRGVCVCVCVVDPPLPSSPFRYIFDPASKRPSNNRT